MNATATRQAARVAALIVVLALAAAFGLVVGEQIRGEAGGAAGAGAAGSATTVDGDYLDYGLRHRQAIVASDGPDQTAPRPHIWAEIDDEADTQNASVTRPTPR